MHLTQTSLIKWCHNFSLQSLSYIESQPQGMYAAIGGNNSEDKFSFASCTLENVQSIYLHRLYLLENVESLLKCFLP